MKSTIFIIILTVSCAVALAISPAWLAAMSKKRTITSSSPPDVLTNDFETGSLPSGWTVTGGSPQWTAQPALQGTYSVYLLSQNVHIAYTNLANNELYAYFMVLWTNVPNGTVFQFYNNTTPQCYLTFSGGSLYVADIGDAHDAHPTVKPTSNTVYYVWVHYRKGTGSDAVCTLGYSTTNQEPTSGTGYFASISSANPITNITSIRFRGSTNTVFDHVGVATFPIPTGW